MLCALSWPAIVRSRRVLFGAEACVNCAAEVGASAGLRAVTKAKLAAGWSVNLQTVRLTAC